MTNPLPTDPILVFSWHVEAIGLEAAWLDYTGAGIAVAVVDDGVSQIVLRLDVVEQPLPDAEDPAYTEIEQRTENAMGSDLLQQFLQQLEQTIEVDVHQAVYDRQYGQS